MAPNSPIKRRRVEIPARVKKQICELKKDSAKMTIIDIKQRIYSETKLDIGISTISEILKEREKWLAVDIDSADLTRARRPKHEQLEDALYLWTNEMTSRHATINDKMMLEKARILGRQLNVGSDFAYSRGWLQGFKGRRGIKRKQ